MSDAGSTKPRLSREMWSKVREWSRGKYIPNSYRTDCAFDYFKNYSDAIYACYCLYITNYLHNFCPIEEIDEVIQPFKATIKKCIAKEYTVIKRRSKLYRRSALCVSVWDFTNECWLIYSEKFGVFANRDAAPGDALHEVIRPPLTYHKLLRYIKSRCIPTDCEIRIHDWFQSDSDTPLWIIRT